MEGISQIWEAFVEFLGTENFTVTTGNGADYITTGDGTNC